MNKILILVSVFFTVCSLIESSRLKKVGTPLKKGQLVRGLLGLFILEVMVSVLWYW